LPKNRPDSARLSSALSLLETHLRDDGHRVKMDSREAPRGKETKATSRPKKAPILPSSSPNSPLETMRAQYRVGRALQSPTSRKRRCKIRSTKDGRQMKMGRRRER
jgi:hypothetical protein